MKPDLTLGANPDGFEPRDDVRCIEYQMYRPHVLAGFVRKMGWTMTTRIYSEGVDEFTVTRPGRAWDEELIKGTMHEVVLFVRGAWRMRQLAQKTMKEVQDKIKTTLDGTFF